MSQVTGALSSAGTPLATSAGSTVLPVMKQATGFDAEARAGDWRAVVKERVPRSRRTMEERMLDQRASQGRRERARKGKKRKR